MPCRSSQRLTGQLVTKPSIMPICIRNQWLELSIGAFQITYCASAIQPNRPTSKLSTERVSAGDVPERAAGAAVAVRERHLPQRVARALFHPGRVRVHALAGHPPSTGEIRPQSDRPHVERGERKSEVHDRHVLPVAQHDDVGDDHERGREPESERHPCEELKPTRSHPQSLQDGGSTADPNYRASMEAPGCGRWQSVANRPRPETAKTSEIRCHRLPPVA